MSRSKQILTAKEILFLTNQGRDIWEKEVGHFSEGRNIKSPVRSGDANASFRIKKSSSGVYIGTDYGGEQWYGNGIDLIQKMYGLSFKDACKKVIHDFNLDRFTEEVKVTKKVVELPSETTTTESDLLIEWDSMPFTKKHHAYWNKGHLTEDFLKQDDIFAVKKLAFNKKVQKLTDSEICFVYYSKELNREKILRVGPEVPKELKWRTNIHNSYLWYFSELEKEKDLFVVKSVKDREVMKLLGFTATATQSENARILEQNIPLILNVCENPILLMGSDPQGVKTCKDVQQKFKTRYLNTPKNLLEYDINDPFSYVSEFGLKRFENFVKAKLKI